MYTYITARSRAVFSRAGLLRRAVTCRSLCALPRTIPRRLRLPPQRRTVIPIATPPRTHGRHAARPQLQSPHGRRRTAAAMRPETRGACAATAQILAALKSWQEPSSRYTASPRRRWSPACSVRGPAATSEDAPRFTPQCARISARCPDPSGSTVRRHSCPRRSFSTKGSSSC